MKNIFLVIAIAIPAILGAACRDETKEDPPVIFPRISIVSQNSDVADVTVEIEGYDGNLVSGAVVLVSNNANEVLKCPYDPYSGSYYSKYPIPSDGIFNIAINSILSSDPLTYTIVHNQIINKPIINILEDSTGSSVLLGQPLDFLRGIHIGWTSSGDDLVYQISIKSAVQTIYESSTESLTLIIPGGTVRIVSGQIYYLQVTAQRITGDPFFRRAKYYSAAIRTGDTLTINAQ